MKILLFVLFPLLSYCQTIDTVCSGETKTYISKFATPKIQWITSGGYALNGDTTDTVTIKWNDVSGTDTLEAVRGSDTEKIAVYRMPLPSVSFSDTGQTNCIKDSNIWFNLNFTGIGPWNILLSDSTYIVNIGSNPFRVQVGHLPKSRTYSILSVTNQFGCSGRVHGVNRYSIYISQCKKVIKYETLTPDYNFAQPKDTTQPPEPEQPKIFEPVVIPNVFTPNGDGLNDTFKIIGLHLINVRIFNRFGEEVFRSENFTGWNGSNAIEGVYLYMVQGWTSDNRKYFNNGKLTLIK